MVGLWVWTGALIVAGSRPIGVRWVDAWSLRFHVVTPDDATRAWVSSRLRRARAIRWSAFGLGVNAGMLPLYMNVIDVERAGDFANPLTNQAPIIAGAFGALLAEVVRGRPRRVARTVAVAPRGWSDYIERYWVGVIAAFVLATFVSTWVVVRSDASISWWWVAPITSLVALSAATLGVRGVVNRPTAATDQVTLRLDDALRADGVHHIVGASLALAGHSALWATSASVGVSAWQTVLGMLSLVLIGVWYGLACRAEWNVERARRLRLA